MLNKYFILNKFLIKFFLKKGDIIKKFNVHYYNFNFLLTKFFFFLHFSLNKIFINEYLNHNNIFFLRKKNDLMRYFKVNNYYFIKNSINFWDQPALNTDNLIFIDKIEYDDDDDVHEIVRAPEILNWYIKRKYAHQYDRFFFFLINLILNLV